MSARPKLKLGICVATMRPDRGVLPGGIETWTCGLESKERDVQVVWNTRESNLGVVGSYQSMYENSTADVLVYLHDDVINREDGWDERVMKEFEDETIGIVGFGGALRHGAPELYKVPYRLQQLRRAQYRSNVDDAEVHGDRFTGACDVAVLDGFALAVRRQLLDRMGGWSKIGQGSDFFCYDYALCGWAHRLGYRVRLVGVRCHHQGGQTSVGLSGRGITGQEAYDKSHRWFYDEFRDCLPWSCE